MSVLRQIIILASPFLAVACDISESNAIETTENETKVETKVIATEAAAEAIQFDKVALRKRFEGIGVSVLDIKPATIDGLFEVVTSGGVIFSTPEGEQFIAGTLYALDKNNRYIDVLAERQAPLNAEKIEEYKDDMIIYPAENEKYVISVFTDITCTYCVRLHSQMQGYNDLGITVRYLAYPRQGPTGKVAEEMARIWCSKEPTTSMTQSKLHQAFDEKVDNLEKCSQTVMDQYVLGRDLGISGTPAVFLPNGKLISGYMSPQDMYRRLQEEVR